MAKSGERSMTDTTTGSGAAAGTAAKIPTALIDMHCHVFNASDLPATTFLYRVATERHSGDPDVTALLIGLIVSLLEGNAPTAAEELDDIRHGRPTKNAAAAVAAAMAGKASGLLDWLKLFGNPRRDLVAQLASFYTNTQHHCELITPALVDYDTWLDNPENDGRRLTDQVAVMGAIAKLPGKPRVHGYVGFDPIRAILADHDFNPAGGTVREPIHPLKLVQEAVTEHGFLGVKLYPPMGFRAWNNGKGDITFSSIVKKYVAVALNKPDNTIKDQDLGERIDAELKKLYRYCADQGVPILAHAYNSNQAEDCTGWRASPQYWGEVIDKFSTPEKPLRLCLGHFGSFSAHTKFPTCTDAFGAKAWEIIIGSILASPKAPYVFADVSYLSEVLDQSDGWQARRKAMRDQFKSFIAKNDPAAEHICYGSDWIMLGREAGHARYHVALGDFLRNDVQLNAAQLNNIYFGNATRFLGLQPGDQNRERLDKFYQNNNIQQHFPKIDPLVG
jgi:predicted TIM-barrel fold metal-dependent hydrolase